MCNGNCNQGRSCNCAKEKQSVFDIYNAVIIGWIAAFLGAATIVLG